MEEFLTGDREAAGLSPTGRGVPQDKMKVRRGWVLEGVSPSHTLEKKNQDMN